MSSFLSVTVILELIIEPIVNLGCFFRLLITLHFFSLNSIFQFIIQDLSAV